MEIKNLKKGGGTMRKLAMFLGIAFLVGCAGAPKAPKWVQRGAAAFPGDEGKYYYGVGVSGKSLNPAMDRQKAEHRARVDLSRAISSYVSSLIKDFMEEWPDYFNPELGGSEEITTSVSKEVSEAVLTGCQTIDHWREPKIGNLWALVRMDRDATNKRFMDSMRNKKRIFLEMKADEALEQLDKELEKRTLREEKMMGQ